jgi:TonB family protein
MSSWLVLIERLGEVIVRGVPPLLAATSALLVVALVGDRLLRNRVSASVRLILYLPVLARAAVPIVWASPLGLLRTSPVATVIVGDGQVVPAAVAPGDLVRWVGLAYLVIAVALLARWASARFSLGRALRSARPLPGTAAFVHDRIGPVVAGVLRPRIVVPASLVSDSEGLALVLRHEAAHVVRRDPLLGAALQIGCILAWPLLPLWIAAARVRALMEVASDERALAGADGGVRRRYGELLLALADAHEPRRRLVAGLAFGSALHTRLRALSTRPRWPAVAQVSVVTLLLAVAVACSGSPSPEPPSGTPATRAQDSIPGVASVRGSLDKDVIRREIRVHIDEIKRCYEPELVRSPDLGGRVVVQFTVGASGSVEAAELQNSTLDRPAVEKCMVSAVRTWQFPRPEGGGIVIVSYPFVLRPS